MIEQTLAGKVALVSGSAWGIGAAICVEIASNQAKDVEAVLERCRETKGAQANECFAIEADLQTVEGPQKLIDDTVARLKGRKIDILVNNAGIAIMKPLVEATLDQWDKQVNLNCRAMFLLTQAVLPHLSKKNCRIINASSAGARLGTRGSTIYNGSKAMVEGFTRCWAVEFGRDYDCTVNAYCPGPTNTHGFQHAGEKFLESMKPILEATPKAGRMADPSEIANAVGLLCEEKAGWITGVCIGPLDIMKAVVAQNKAPVLVTDRPQPNLRPEHVLIRTVAVALNPTDWKHAALGIAADGNLLGCDFSGIVVEVGSAVTKSLRPGDEVLGVAHGGCPEQPEDGAFAEYIVAKGDTLMLKPKSLSFEKAATISLGAITCGQGLFQQGLKLKLPGQGVQEKSFVLIYGGSTATGSLGIQFATLAGYSVVTTTSKANFQRVKDLGAIEAFDYNDPDVGRKIRDYTNNTLKYAWDTYGKEQSSLICADALSTEAGGVYSSVLPSTVPRADVKSVSTVMYTMFGEEFSMKGKVFPASQEDWELAKKFMTLTEKLIADNKLKTHPEAVRPNGLQGVLEGLGSLKAGVIRAQKLVYRVAETP
ncbi:hypothetical protein FPRO05_10520 [Fusarium proliferatum]|uniref:Enoyl reductase (ER) domain-containing protein n=1 Tax=Gibberella intermedia TaxID=948311 RepID=A0A365NBP0_GIBIN|nr:hypothetical protein FPRO05_10520 [Fusarium proliferatum]